MNISEKLLIAHTHLDEHNEIKIQTLSEHLSNTSSLTGQFAAAFNAKPWGELIGLWHDIGKSLPAFQQYIRQSAGIIEIKRNISTAERAHAAVGAVAIKQLLSTRALPIAYCIEGHHKGLSDWYSGLDQKLSDELNAANLEKWNSIKKEVSLPKPEFPPFPKLGKQELFHQWIRMLFSCLVDADRLDTERFSSPQQAAQRGTYDSLDILKERLDTYLKKFESAPATPLNQERQRILHTCQEKGKENNTGFFSLTVPTGGGKTLSGMAWALNHALVTGKERIIVAIPYTSIITQTAAEYRKIFGSNNVLEHHSNLSEEMTEEINANDSLRLSAENWDAPIIVTTNVQLFESLHSHRPSMCRKIHRVANAVVILDEAQMLPVEFLKPILHCLDGLVSLFNSSVLFTTATQPLFSGKIGLRKGMFEGVSSEINELIFDSDGLFQKFKRVTIHELSPKEAFTPELLAAELCKHKQVLCVVNTRSQAQAICQLMPEDTIHLSRNMYSQHLMNEITRVRALLAEGSPIRVVSTQLIEAGVDIDFPIVYRAFAGLDSIIQAAGRCNREGKLEMGHAYVFRWEGERAQGFISMGQNTLADLLHVTPIDQLSTPTVLKRYFELFYGRMLDMDKPKTKELLYTNACECKFSFETYSQNFRLIDEKGTEPLLVTIEGGAKIYEKLQQKERLTLMDYRQMQRFTVCVSSQTAKKIKEQMGIEEIDGINILNTAFYNKHYGVVVDGAWTEEFLNI